MVIFQINFRPNIEGFVKKVVLASVLLSGTGLANVVGVDTQNFNPTSNGLDFVTVQSSETLEPGVFNLGLFANHAVNTLAYYKDSTGNRTRFRDSLTSGDINAGVGIMRNWDLGISFPQIFSQSVKDKGDRTEFSSNGNTEIRLNTKVRLLGNAKGGLAVVGTVGLNRIQNNPYVGKDAGPTSTLEIAADTSISQIALGANIGYRWRSAGEKLPDFPIEPMKNQYIASAAASYHIKSISSKIIFEVFGSWPVSRVNADINRHMYSMEALLGLKHDLTSNVALHAGGGTELQNGVSSPDMRGYVGTNITAGPFWGKPALKKTVRKVKAAPVAPEAMPEPEIEPTEMAATPPAAGTVETVVMISNVLFAFDSDQMVLQGAYQELEKLAQYIMAPPQFKKLTIEGHTDYMGSDEYNRDLSQRRADAVMRHLIKKHNLPADRIEAIGYGESRPVADNGNFQGRQQNRRVEFRIER
jgi:outer membrane protein OmpA-like peptidoglycan-associated protein